MTDRMMMIMEMAMRIVKILETSRGKDWGKKVDDDNDDNSEDFEEWWIWGLGILAILMLLKTQKAE